MSPLFPETRVDLVAAHARDGCPAALAVLERHVAATYERPLRDYYRSTSWHRAYGVHEDWRDDAAVQSFLGDKVIARREHFWRLYHQSGKRLHRYLVNGLHFHLHEQYRSWLRHRPGHHPPPEPVHEPEPGAAADRAVLRSMLRLAFARTLADLRRRGHGTHRRLLVRVHGKKEASIPDAARRLGLTPGQAKGQHRLARALFAAAVRDLFERDGVPPDRVQDEIDCLLEILHGPGPH